MKFLDLFSGIGGFRSGMEKAGHECVGYVEIDKYARLSYQAIYKTKGLYTAHDVRTIKANELPKADIWCFGFPCQDLSVAGRQKGFEGNRSSLFFATTKLLRRIEEDKKPRYLLIENVKNLLSVNRGWDFAKFQIEMDEIGYNCEWDVLDTAEVLPQHRERIYIVGHLRGQRTEKVFPITRQGGKTNKEIKEITKINQVGNISKSRSYNGNPQVGRVYGTDGIAPTLNTMQGGGREPKILDISSLRIRKLTPLECWRLQGFTDDQFYKAKQVNSNTQLYKQAGNSVSVPIVYEIAKKMKKEDNK